MIKLVTHFATEETASGIGALGIDVKAFVIQLITFILAFLVLKKYAFKPILKVLKERQDTIDKGVKLGEQMKKEKAEMDEKVADALHKARQEADKILAEAQSTGRQSIQDAEDAARAKAEEMINQASVRIKQDTQVARKRLERDLAGLVSQATEAILREKIDSKRDSALIDKALKESAR
jgi:F-type H+-transporting ATPase subunit b